VRAVVQKGNSQPISVTDYYPFGEQLPSRTKGNDLYRYAFQGQELDKETGMEAFQLRLWDGRIGRWLSTDPYGQYASPYLGMGNNPISSIDPDGGYSWAGAFLRWMSSGFEGKMHQSTKYHDWGIITKLENGETGAPAHGDVLAEVLVGYKSDYGKRRYSPGAFDGVKFVGNLSGKLSAGFQLGVKGSVYGIRGGLEGGLLTSNFLEGNLGTDGNKFGFPQDAVMHNFFGVNANLTKNIGLGIKGDYNYRFNAYSNSIAPVSPARFSWQGTLGLKNVGKGVDVFENKIILQPKVNIKIKADDKIKSTIELSAGIKAILGIEGNLELGIQY
jgi:RHS repeat-associated protein